MIANRLLALVTAAFMACSTARHGFAAGARPASPADTTLLRSGTAFIVSRDGYMLTSAHVVRGCQKIEIWPSNAPPLAARLAAMDDQLDIALLSTERMVDFAATPPAVPLKAGQAIIYTIGFGLTPSTPRVPVLTQGFFDGTAWRDGRPMLVIRARLYEGNSGGPVIDTRGALQGMVIGRYVARPDLSVAVRSKEIAGFLKAHGIESMALQLKGQAGGSRREQLSTMASLVQCAQTRR
jgi:S1-C subfamily serine protease